MTVIVALPNRMLSDSRVVVDGEHFPASKIYRVRKSLVGVAGDNRYIEQFMRWFRGSRKKPLDLPSDAELAVVVVNRKGIWDYRGSMPDLVDRPYHGVGSGWSAAHAAMVAGADARRAIEIACEVTNFCGLPVREETL